MCVLCVVHASTLIAQLGNEEGIGFERNRQGRMVSRGGLEATSSASEHAVVLSRLGLVCGSKVGSMGEVLRQAA